MPDHPFTGTLFAMGAGGEPRIFVSGQRLELPTRTPMR